MAPATKAWQYRAVLVTTKGALVRDNTRSCLGLDQGKLHGSAERRNAITGLVDSCSKIFANSAAVSVRFMLNSHLEQLSATFLLRQLLSNDMIPVAAADCPPFAFSVY